MRKQDELEELYRTCLYNGIVEMMKIMEHMEGDHTEELTYLTDRYTAEHGPDDGGAVDGLEERLERYKNTVKRGKVNDTHK